MTMTTRVAILDPIPPAKVHATITQIVGGDETTQARETTDEFGNVHLRNIPGQGLGALVWLSWHQDGPYAREEDDDGPPCALEVGIDTPYSGSEGQPHILATLGAWLDDHGARWMWHDEWTGTWHASTVPMEV